MATVTRQIWDRDAQELGLYLALIAVTLGFVAMAFRRQIKILWTVCQINGPPVYPILGNANYMLRDDVLHVMSHTAYKDYGPVARFWLTLLPYVLLFEPDDVQAVLGSAKHTRKIYFYRLLDNFLGKGLITSDVDTWRRHRRLLQPAFHLHVLDKFVGSFAECADRLSRRLQKHHGQQLDITKFVNDAVYEILNETVLGVNVASKADGDGVVNLDDLPFRKGQMVVPYRIIRPWLLLDWVYKLTSAGQREKKQSEDLSRACRRMIEEKRKAGQSSNGRTSLLEYMMEMSDKNPSNFDDEDIIDECSTFMLAGQDSVGTATAVTLFLLANHADWRDKCVRELDEIFREDPLRSPNMRDLKAMRWLECCIKEALRLYPSVPIFARTLGEDVKIGKHVIPAGCGVMILPYATHRLAHHFPDPHSFRPERFSPGNSEKRHPYAYLPFSAGPRNCIGYKFAILEMKAMISAILRRFHLDGVEGKTEVRPKFRLTVRASGGLWLKITQRPDVAVAAR
ncbi:probable cytochrome P450 4aa1 isoform X2 [Phymastichus coffea]|uniref:probable cytochrome P450 4aa1 isoform X2 n=1 Tax=Phymastichus coffea TaxID=108790 RepID=UPI00273C7649|nr:probable cytochrome P450 4aa1 isoform X2 [Phymastichus coffea]